MRKQDEITKQKIPQLLHYHLPQFDEDKLEIRQTFGLTNKTFVIHQDGLQSVLFRILSPIIDRKYQNKVLQSLDQSKLTPKILYACQKYRIQQFIDNAHCPSSDQINKDIPLLKKVLSNIYRLHQVKLPPYLQKQFFDDVVFTETKKKKYLKQVCKQKNKKTEFQKLKLALLSDFDKLHQRIKLFKQKRLELSFSHNDANNNNILIHQKNGKQRVLLIDYEYSCYNYACYDIANLLNECCFQYTEQQPGFKVYKKVAEEQIKQACELYPGKYVGMQNDVKFMLMVCNYFWALWSLEAAQTSTNFSPVEHGKARLELYKFYSQKISQH